jgi:hypothetical protein
MERIPSDVSPRARHHAEFSRGKITISPEGRVTRALDESGRHGGRRCEEGSPVVGAEKPKGIT